jgi:isochorismate hydrolase
VGQQKIDRNSLLIKDLRFYFLTKNPKSSNLGSFVATNVARFLPKIGFD